MYQRSLTDFDMVGPAIEFVSRLYFFSLTINKAMDSIWLLDCFWCWIEEVQKR